jgi:hypothetical protein
MRPPGYSRWNPYSLYSIYDHLSGGRQLCHLPSEPCDNQHRVQNKERDDATERRRFADR